MTDRAAARDLAHAFIAAVREGHLPDSLLTDDMTGWITTGGTVSRAAYQGMIASLKQMLDGPIEMTVDAITAEDDRVVIEAHSQARLVNGESYANTYVYVLRVRDGRFCSIAEHYNALVAREKLVPLMKQLNSEGKMP
ncbi:nuclear transport factor 2 family protein [Novosphingobium sp. TH158]|uniref:nuclear transport factor 2 family protein n=1 Tax=Novosphingobium sp. TH158 TaxID=2067455 RepID=UPI0013042012|nr:nuclear transport factor 2 family protein [Novosphingobium sp. TH158]